jgi:hypothetical protein
MPNEGFALELAHPCKHLRLQAVLATNAHERPAMPVPIAHKSGEMDASSSTYDIIRLTIAAITMAVWENGRLTDGPPDARTGQ